MDLSEFRHTLGLLEDDPRVVTGKGAHGFALVCDPGIRPVGDARATTAALLVTHHVAPFGAIDVAVSKRERIFVLIHVPIVPSAEDVPNFVRDRKRDGSTGMVDNEIGLVRIGADARR